MRTRILNVIAQNDFRLVLKIFPANYPILKMRGGNKVVLVMELSNVIFCFLQQLHTIHVAAKVYIMVTQNDSPRTEKAFR